MNRNTADALIWFAEKVKQMAIADMTHIGENLAREIIESADRLQKNLETDETIP